MSVRPQRTVAAICGGLVLAALLAGPVPASAVTDAPGVAVPEGGDDRPNVVVVMVDDASMELLDHVPAAREMITEGVTFDNYIVSAPLCCPSRATFLAGQYPHNTGVLHNGGPDGGFKRYAEERDIDIGSSLQQDGYRTGFIGKYMNGYDPHGKDGPNGYEPGLLPLGWDEWTVGGGYAGWHYTQVESVDRLPPPGENIFDHDGETEEDYYTDFARDRALAFLGGVEDQPFALFVNTFASHKGLGPNDPDHAYEPLFPPAPRDRKRTGTEPPDWDTAQFVHGDCGGGPGGPGGGCLDLTAPDPMWAESFDTVGTSPPNWRADLDPLTPDQLADATVFTRQRAQSLQAVSDLIDELRETLGTEMDNTYLVFTSDNGFFLGQHRLWNGKGTAYDHDVRVPLVIVPPGGLDEPRTVTEIVQNVDLAPTFADIAGAPLLLPTDGMSLLPWLGAPEDLPTTWRDGGLVSFEGGEKGLGPDRSRGSAIIPAYKALRTTEYLYIDNGTVDATPPKNHGRGEFYWLPTDGEQINNLYDTLSSTEQQALNDALVTFSSCDGAACPAIDLPEVTP